MTTLQAVIFTGKLVGLAALLVGLVVRRGYRACYMLAAYVVAILVPDLVFLVWPQTFFWSTWIAAEIMQVGMKFALAAELGWRIFGALPGARATLVSALLFVSLITLWTVVGTSSLVSPQAVAQAALARALHGSAWTFGALLSASLYFRLPMHPLHQAVLRGFVPYLLTFTVALSLLETYGPNIRVLASYGNAVAYVLLLVYWNVVAWRKADDPQVPPEVMQKLQPWR